MPLKLDYPAALTDAEWKKAEKKAGVSDTGIGKTLRTLDAAVKAFNAALAKVPDNKTNEGLEDDDPDLAALKPLLATARTAGKAAFDTVKAQHTAAKAGSKAKTLLTTYFNLTNRCSSELSDFDLVDHRGLKVPVKSFNDRVK